MSRKIIFVSYGDSRSAVSWSNIPYLFSENLEKKGFELIRLDINPNPETNLWWGNYVYRYLSILFPNHYYSYIRTWFFRRETFQKIKKIVRENPDAYFCIFLNFEFYNKFSKVPSLLFGDWTYDIVILDRLNRKPYFFEKWFTKYQRKAIKNAEIVVSLFKDARDSIAKRYQKDVKHLGINVINDINNSPISDDEVLEAKKNTHQILFIGTPKYLEGAKKLLSAFKILQKKYPEIQLNIIGIKEDELFEKEKLVENVNCFGYLKKDNQEDNKTYYNLLTQAKVLVNPSETWAAYSSSIEAMKYFTPVIIKPYEAFVKDFGTENDFGYYLENTEIETIVNAIEKVMFSENYLELCKNANARVKDYTWDNYIEKIVELMQEVKISKSTL